MFRLSLQTEGQEPKKFTFDQDEVTIGREPTSDIHLGTSNVSKRHARIVRREGRYFIVDRKSTNGSFVNGARVSTPQVLKSGDRIFIGDYVMIFDLDETKPQRSDTKIEGDKKEENTDVLTKKPAPSAPPPLPKKPEFAPTAKKPSIELSAEEIPDKEPPMSPEMANKLGPTRYMPAVKIEDLGPETPPPSVEPPTPPAPPVPPPPPPAPPKRESAVVPPPPPLKKAAPAPEPEPEKYEASELELPAVDVYNAELAAKLFLTVIDKPELSENEDLLSFDFDTEENAKAAEEALAAAAKELKITQPEVDAAKAHVISELIKFGPVTGYLADDGVKEIFATSRGDLFVYRDGSAMERRSGFSCPDALLIAMGRLASIGGGALEDVENEPFSVYAADKFAAKMYIATDGGDSWMRVIKYPRNKNALAKMDAKVKEAVAAALRKGGKVLVGGGGALSRAEIAAALAAEAASGKRIVYIGAEDCVSESSNAIVIPYNGLEYELGDKLRVAAALDPALVVVYAPVGASTPIADILNFPSDGLVWVVPSGGADAALKSIKNVLAVSSSITAEAAAAFAAEALNFVMCAREGRLGAELSKVEKISGTKGAAVSTEIIYKA